MTLSTSAVAVCCSERFAQLVEQPRVLDGDDGLGGEVLDQLDLLVGEGPNLLAIDNESANQARSPSALAQRAAFGARQLDTSDGQWIAVELSSSADRESTTVATGMGDRCDADRASVEQSGLLSMDSVNARWRVREAANEAEPPPSARQIPNLASQIRVAFSSMALKTGSKLAGRAADDLQHLRGRGLLLEARSCARSSLSSRVFSMAMTAWAAKF